MNLLQRLEFWGDRHHPKWMDIIRIALGVFLCYKGIDFLGHMSDLVSVMYTQTSTAPFFYLLAGHYAAAAHILGGIFLTLGVMTRIACIIQIPVLLGAIFFISTNQEMLRPYSELALTVIILLLLIYFLIAGNGPWSVKVTDDGEKK
jgi:putative oxidoreductase